MKTTEKSALIAQLLKKNMQGEGNQFCATLCLKVCFVSLCSVKN
jgi:hypothetical protein